uniref:Uncharacterized protein n=1 Tax=Caenorhabditis japonica TaxID=281687 RepID=A0A8R1I6U3_CAEJA
MVSRYNSRQYILLAIATFFFILILFYGNDRNDLPAANLHDYKIKTFNGFVSMQELNDNVYKKFGYQIIRPTFPVPTLGMLREQTCDVVFENWLRINQEPQPAEPPKEIPADRKDEFLLYGYSAVKMWYLNDKSSAEKGEKPRKWDIIGELLTWSKERLAGMAYGSEGESMFNAMKAYKLDGQSGVVIGSMQPWVEVSALVNGAKKILTVEYNKLTIQEEFRDRMSSILPVDFAKGWANYADTFNFAASFSSIEHSGLGRYGDPMDPIGDIREILKIKCVLKKGGLLFLGFPLGTDSIVYNAHRIYGPIRLAMMFYGFEWIATFSGRGEDPIDLNSATLHARQMFEHAQSTLVLRKL